MSQNFRNLVRYYQKHKGVLELESKERLPKQERKRRSKKKDTGTTEVKYSSAEKRLPEDPITTGTMDNRLYTLVTIAMSELFDIANRDTPLHEKEFPKDQWIIMLHGLLDDFIIGLLQRKIKTVEAVYAMTKE